MRCLCLSLVYQWWAEREDAEETEREVDVAAEAAHVTTEETAAAVPAAGEEAEKQTVYKAQSAMRGNEPLQDPGVEQSYFTQVTLILQSSNNQVTEQSANRKRTPARSGRGLLYALGKTTR